MEAINRQGPGEHMDQVRTGIHRLLYDTAGGDDGPRMHPQLVASACP